MDAKTTGIVAYLTWIGFIIAICAGDKDGAIFHVNQSLVIIPCVGGIWGIFMLVCWIMGLVAAINQEEKEVPLIGKIRILK